MILLSQQFLKDCDVFLQHYQYHRQEQKIMYAAAVNGRIRWWKYTTPDVTFAIHFCKIPKSVYDEIHLSQHTVFLN